MVKAMKLVKRKTLRRSVENQVWAALRVKIWKVPRSQVMAEYELPEATLRGWIKDPDPRKKKINPIALIVVTLDGACTLLNLQSGRLYVGEAEHQLLAHVYDRWKLFRRQKRLRRSTRPRPVCSRRKTDRHDGTAAPKGLRANRGSLASKRMQLVDADDPGYRATTSAVESKLPDAARKSPLRDSDTVDVDDPAFAAGLLFDFKTRGERTDEIEQYMVQYALDG